MKKLFSILILSMFVFGSISCDSKSSKCESLYKTLKKCTNEDLSDKSKFMKRCKKKIDKKKVKKFINCAGKDCKDFYICVHGEERGTKKFERFEKRKAEKK